jgi:hypothetical protein
MPEQVNDKTVALSVKAAKLTGRLLAGAMRAWLKKAREPTTKHGKQSIHTLSKQGASLSNIEVTGDNIGSFRRTTRKYNVAWRGKREIALILCKASGGEILPRMLFSHISIGKISIYGFLFMGTYSSFLRGM